MRRYEKGQIVGTIDPPIPFEDWLWAELQQAHSMKPSKDNVMDCACANQRVRALEEVQAAWNRAKEMRATVEGEQ